MQKLLGGILKGCGILVAGLSGLCMFIALGTFLGDGGAEEFVTFLPTILTIGGIPLAFGVGLFFLGRHLQKSAREE